MVHKDGEKIVVDNKVNLFKPKRLQKTKQKTKDKKKKKQKKKGKTKTPHTIGNLLKAKTQNNSSVIIGHERKISA